MWEAIVAVIGLVGSAAGAIWAAYVGTRRRVLAELEGRYDADLRGLRLAVYPKLWAALEPLAKYARERPGRPTRDEIAKLAGGLRGWYFNDGGLYLSAEAREAYFDLQRALTAVITSPRWSAAGTPADEIDPDTFESLRTIGSWLRTALTYDVGTRRRFSLAPAWQDEDAEANQRAVEEDRAAKRNAKRLGEELRSAWAKPAGYRNEMAGWAARSIDEVPTVTDGEADDPDWHPLQHFFGLTTFGANVFVATSGHETLVGEHDERASGQQELYVVLEGEADFELAGEQVRATKGTIIAVNDPAVKRRAVARVAGTRLLAVGAGDGMFSTTWNQSHFENVPVVRDPAPATPTHHDPTASHEDIP